MGTSTNLIGKVQLSEVGLSAIVGVEEQMLAYLRQNNLIPHLESDVDLWQIDALERHLYMNPITLIKYSQGYFCIGGFRRYLIAKALYCRDDPDHKVTVFVRPGRLSGKVRMQLLLEEYFVAPSVNFVSRAHSEDLRLLWATLTKDGSPMASGSRGDFDRVMRFLPRRKKLD